MVLPGVIDNIPYLEELGITAIWFNPIFEAPSNHKYDTSDYMKIDPSFGDLDKFKEMVSRLPLQESELSWTGFQSQVISFEHFRTL